MRTRSDRRRRANDEQPLLLLVPADSSLCWCCTTICLWKQQQNHLHYLLVPVTSEPSATDHLEEEPAELQWNNWKRCNKEDYNYMIFVAGEGGDQRRVNPTPACCVVFGAPADFASMLHHSAGDRRVVDSIYRADPSRSLQSPPCWSRIKSVRSRIKLTPSILPPLILRSC